MSSTIIPQCPKCARVLHFSNEKINIIQCQCSAIVGRGEGGALQEKNFYPILQPVELMQPGTLGKWNEKDFKVLGRFRGWFQESVFNYWTILFNDGEIAYLGEGYGFYSILKRATLHGAIASHNLDRLHIGANKKLLKDVDFVLEKKYECSKWEVEGELSMPDTGNAFSIFEFAAGNGQQISLFEFMKNSLVAYEVFYLPFTSFQFTNLRRVPNPGKQFTCNTCKSQVHVKTYPYAQSCACNNCGMHYEMKSEGNFKSFGERNSLDKLSEITLGSKGIIKGIEYEVIGYSLKEEKNQYASQWKEYTLYNAEEGFAFLSEYNGHWVYLREQAVAPVIGKTDQTLYYGEESFQLFNRYSFLVVNAQGEFPYNVFNPEGVEVREFISPPEVWIQENSKREGIVWFLGTHIEGSEVNSNFNLPAGLPLKTGVGAVEPKMYVNSTRLLLTAFVTVFSLIILHIIVSGGMQSRELLNNVYTFNDSSDVLNISSRKFTLEKWKSNLMFDITAPVDNSWFELNATLVNTETGVEYNISKGVEYYHGISEGESWSEGDRHEVAYLEQIPAGTYFLQVSGQRESLAYNRLPDFSLQVTYNVSTQRNMWICILLLLIWLAVQYYISRTIEQKRWSNSPFSANSYED